MILSCLRMTICVIARDELLLSCFLLSFVSISLITIYIIISYPLKCDGRQVYCNKIY